MSLRFLFVSSTTGGGSGRSQRELAARLVARGHTVVILADDKRRQAVRRWGHEQLVDAEVKLAGRPGGRAVAALCARVGRSASSVTIDDVDHRITIAPENALGALLAEARPDVIVGNSVSRVTWRKVLGAARRERIATILYLREVTSFGHLERLDHPADALVANASSLADGARERGFACALVPSVIDTTRTATTSTRTTALLVNPVASKGVDLVEPLARRLPDIPFVLQESWPLDDEDLARLAVPLALGNVELRRRREPGPELYADARVVLLPCLVDQRPRVVAEAQANGIPVLATPLPGLREAVGPGGRHIDLDDVEGWVAAIQEAWSDEEAYAALGEAARAHSHRAALAPEHVAERFEEVARRAQDVARGR